MLVLQDLHTDVLWNLMLFSRQLRHLVRRRIASVLHDCKKRAIPEPDFPHLRLRRAGLIHHLRHRLHSWSGTFGRERGSRERPSHVLSAHTPHIGSICCVVNARVILLELLVLVSVCACVARSAWRSKCRGILYAAPLRHWQTMRI